MDGLVQWGLAVVQWIQTWRNPVLDQFFLTINFLGDEEFYLLFFPLIFWCFNKAIGYRLAFLFLFSEWTNQVFKNLFAAPRPYQVDPKLYAPLKTTGYGIPSGHTQGAVVTWGNLATQLKTGLSQAFAFRGFARTAPAPAANACEWWTLAIIIPLGVGIGRMYLGDHFPQDVIAGAVIGIVLVAGYAAFQPRASAWLNARASFALKLALAVIVPLALAALFLSTAAVSLGALLGFSIGLVLEEEYVRFGTRGAWWKQIVKFAIGVAIALGLRFALKPLLPAGDVFTFVRYAAIGLWMALGAPWVFVVVRLSQRTTAN